MALSRAALLRFRDARRERDGKPFQT